MILERKPSFNPEDLSMTRNMADGLFGEPERMAEMMRGFVHMQLLYSAAMREISTKLEILDDEFHAKHAHNPVHYIESRLKHPRSIFAKLSKRGLPVSVESAVKHLTDIAGVRVVCHYLDDVYTVAGLLTKQDDVTVLRRTDYIAAPKANGYRSLHIVVSVPVFLAAGTEHAPVEIQLRTVAMDFWASLEHELHYKSPQTMEERLKERLLFCAEGIAEIDATMQDIHRSIQTEEREQTFLRR